MIVALMMIVACAGVPQDAAPADPAAAWLEKIEARAGEVESLSAKITYTREQGLLGDRQHRYGTLAYRAGPPAKFLARFDRLAVDDALHPMDKTYVFDGRYLVERDDEERIWSRWELAGEGESADLLALGEGPFSLPLNMKKERVLKRFEAALGSQEEEGKLVHLVLTPREDSGLDVTKVDLWFDRETLLLVRARQEEGDDATDVKLRDVVVNPEKSSGDFDTAPPTGAGWQVNDHPRAEEDAPAAPDTEQVEAPAAP